MNFPLSAKTQGLIGQVLRLEEISKDTTAASGPAQASLLRLQKDRVATMMESGAGSASSNETSEAIKAARERCLDLDSTIQACKAKRDDLLPQILASLESDKKCHLKELEAEAGELGAQESQLWKNYLSALAAAGAAQMKLLGFWSDMEKVGPHLTKAALRNEKHRGFFWLELRRMCAESGVSESTRPMSELTTMAQARCEVFRRALTIADVEQEIEKARAAQTLEKRGNWGARQPAE
ncbi:MAG: hypothetical protein WAN11_27135 [Syntrophobacteraceae bacterium]